MGATIGKQPWVGGERQLEPTKRVEGQHHRTSRAPPPIRIQHRPREDTWKRRRTQRKREKHKNRGGFTLVRKSRTIKFTDTPDCSCQHNMTDKSRVFGQSTKDGKPKLHLTILRVLVTAAESCKDHRKQKGRWEAERV